METNAVRDDLTYHIELLQVGDGFATSN
jgi:hypothetical protein